jgi:DNA ligase 1
MPSTQTSLNKFFGVKSDTKKQTTLSSFVKKGKENNDSSASTTTSKRESPTANASIHDPAEDKMKDVKRRKRVIEDDSDDDATVELNEVSKQLDDADDTAMELSEDNTKVKAKEEADKKTQAAPVSTKPKDNKTSTSTAKKESEKVAKKIISSAKKSEESTSSKKSESEESSSSAAGAPLPAENKWSKDAAKLCKALKLTPNEDLIQDIGVQPGEPILYQTLTKALDKIEKITGRLEIQSIMTKLFRQVLLTTPQDLYPLIYLASNSVAPAYECVELGIGDSILIKAIGEASGTKPGMYMLFSGWFLLIDKTFLLFTK